MNNLCTIQEAWLANGAPMADTTINLQFSDWTATIYPPESCRATYAVSIWSRFSQTGFECPDLATALDRVATMARTLKR